MKRSEAIKLFGSRNKLARALGITKQAISLWGNRVPELRVYQIREILEKRERRHAVSEQRSVERV